MSFQVIHIIYMQIIQKLTVNISWMTFVQINTIETIQYHSKSIILNQSLLCATVWNLKVKEMYMMYYLKWWLSIVILWIYVEFSGFDMRCRFGIYCHIYTITTVTWSKESNHVELTGADHWIARDVKRWVWSDDSCLSTRRDPTLLIKLL
jgi:hypothetical protein